MEKPWAKLCYSRRGGPRKDECKYSKYADFSVIAESVTSLYLSKTRANLTFTVCCHTYYLGTGLGSSISYYIKKK